MKLFTTRNMIFGVLLVAGLAANTATAQISAQDQAAKLRAQLAEVQIQESRQQTRLQQLEEALIPENIANSLAGVGSTHPEELREQRRRVLEKEKLGVLNQLEQLKVSRSNLEKAIAAADARAYQESARGPEGAARGPQVGSSESSSSGASTSPPKSSLRKVRHHRRRAARRTTTAPINH